MKSIKKNAASNVFYKLLNISFPLVTSIYISRILLVEGVGKVALSQTIASYFTVFATIGLPYYGMRAVSKVRNDVQKLNKLFTELVLLEIVTSIISSFVYCIVILRIPSMYAELPLYLASGIVICLNAFNIDWLYQGKEEYLYIICRSVLIKVISLIAMFLLVRDKSDYIIYAWITSFATCGNHFLNLLNARKYVKFCFKDINVIRHIKPLIIMVIGEMLGSIYGKLDIIMLGIIQDEACVGYYSYAFKIEHLVLSVCTAMTAVLMPRFIYLCSKNNESEFKVLLDKGIRVLLFIVSPTVVGIEILAPKLVVLLFGEAFYAVAITLRVLALLIPIKSFGDLLCFQMMICFGKERSLIPSNAFGSIANVILNVALIGPLGSVGAAIASVLSEIVCNGYRLKIVRKQVAIPYPTKAIVQATISTMVMAGCVLYANSIDSSLFVSCIFCAITGVTVYMGLNLLLRNEILLSLVFKLARRKLD